MLRWVGVLLILCIIVSGCIMGPSGEKSQNAEGTVNVTGSPMPAPGSEEAMVGNVTTIGNVTLSFNRPVYQVSEEVRGSFTFNGTLLVYPLFTMQKLENGTWAWLGYHTFGGAQYIGGAFPPCEEFQASESSPILLSWNQELSGGEFLADLNPANITTEPAGPGTYRISLAYGTKSCFEEFIEAGFTIR